MAEIIPYLFVRDVGQALDFYTRAFGFAEEMRTGTPSGGVHAQMQLGRSTVMMGQGGESHGFGAPLGSPSTMGVFVWVSDVDAHYARAAEFGAKIEHPPRDEFMAGPTRRATWTAIPGSSPPRRSRARASSSRGSDAVTRGDAIRR